MRIPRHGSIESKWRASLLTITSALPAAARAKYLSSFGSWHSRTASVGSIRSAATTTMSRIRLRRFYGDEAIEFGAEDDVTVLVLGLLREDKPVGWINGSQ